MIDLGEVMGELARAGLNESVRVAGGMFSNSGKRAERREAAYADFATALERAHVRIVLVHAVAAGRKHPLGFVANVTGYGSHVGLVDRLATDLVALSAALQKVNRAGDEEVADKARKAVKALSTLATTAPRRSKLRVRFNQQRQNDVEKSLIPATQEFRAAAAMGDRQ